MERRGPLGSLWRHLGALCAMGIGAALVFGLLVWMNEYTERPQRAEQAEGTVVQLAPRKPPKKKARRRRPKRAQRAASRPRPRATPPPNLASGLSSVSLGPPGGMTAGAGQGGGGLLGDAERDLVMTSDTVDEPPRATRRVAPQYPPQARKRGITGYVLLSLTIGPSGDVQRAKVIKAEPQGIFEQAALSTVRGWGFSPGRYKGAAQTVTGVKQKIIFNLTAGG